MIHSDFMNKEASRKRYWARSMVRTRFTIIIDVIFICNTVSIVFIIVIFTILLLWFIMTYKNFLQLAFE